MRTASSEKPRTNNPKGRPPKPPEQRKTTLLTIRVTEQQKQILRVAAAKRRLDLATFVRALALEVALREIGR